MLQLRLQLPVVILQDLHPGLQTTFVLPQQFSLCHQLRVATGRVAVVFLRADLGSGVVVMAERFEAVQLSKKSSTDEITEILSV